MEMAEPDEGGEEDHQVRHKPTRRGFATFHVVARLTAVHMSHRRRNETPTSSNDTRNRRSASWRSSPKIGWSCMTACRVCRPWLATNHHR